jgi:predicted amidohydrolase YtcJ
MCQQPVADTVFTGRLWCPTNGDLTAIAVSEGRIVAVDAEALALREQAAEHIEITDGLLIPAFGDGHAHPLFGGLESEGPQIREQPDIPAIVEEVRRWAEANPEAEWILGASYDSTYAPEGLFDARWLDEAVPDRPVALRAGDYHTMWVNTRALELAGITAESPNPILGEIPRRPDGSALGTLREWGAIDLVTSVATPWPMETRIRSLERAAYAYKVLGVTWVQDAWVEPDTLEVYLAAAEFDRLPVRFNLALYADPRHWPEQLDWFLEARDQVAELNHPHLSANTIKFFADGVVENSTAAVLDHYCGCPGDTGMLVWEPELLTRAVTEIDAAGFQAHIHTIGDQAVRVALDAIEVATRVNGPRDRRPVLAHVQLVSESDRRRFAELGVIANASPLWAQLDEVSEQLMQPRLGGDRSAQQYPLATLRRLGAAMSFGSDWPVSSADPIEGLATGCSRQTAAREPDGGWIPDERLAIEDAFRCYTAGVAEQAFRQAGQLAVGYDADLVLLSADPREVTEPREIDMVRVVRAWSGGDANFHLH